MENEWVSIEGVKSVRAKAFDFGAAKRRRVSLGNRMTV
jgi:hypothetical protein